MATTSPWYDGLDLDTPTDYLADLAAHNDALMLARRGYYPDATGKYWSWSGKWGEYCYLTAAEMVAEYCTPALLRPLPGTSLVCLDREAYLAEERGNTCPECDGLGIVAGALLCTPYDSPDEYEELSCLACNGAGELTEPADEPIAIDHQAIDAWLDSHSAQDYLPESED